MSIQRNDFRLCRTVREKSLLLAHPTDGDKCSTSEDTQDCPWGWFRQGLQLQGRQQSLSLGTIPIDNVVLHFPRDNSDGSLLYDECMKLILLIVCRKPESILWLLLQVCWQIIKCQVVLSVPDTSMSRQFVSILLTILQLIQVPLSWNGDHPSKDLRLSFTALSFCSPVRNISHRICWASPSMDHATVLAWGFPHTGNFWVATAENWDLNISLYRSIMFSFGLHSRWVQDQAVSSTSSTWEPYSAMPAILMSSTYTDKNNSCFRWTNRHSEFGTFSSQSSIRTSSNCLSHNSPASVCPYKFLSRGTTGSSMFDKDFGHLCRGRRIHYQDTLILEFWAIWEHPPSLPGCMLIRRQLAIAVICDADEPCSVNTAYAPVSSFTMSPRSTTPPLYLWNFGSNSAFLRWQMSINVAKWTFC